MFYLLASTYERENVGDVIVRKESVQKIAAIKIRGKDSSVFVLNLIIDDDRAVAKFNKEEEIRKVIFDITDDKKISDDFLISDENKSDMTFIRKKLFKELLNNS